MDNKDVSYIVFEGEMLIDGICYEPLAEEFELSVRQVKNVVYKGEQRLIRNQGTVK